MQKKRSFTFYCPVNLLETIVREPHDQMQRRIFKFVRKYKSQLNNMVAYKKIFRKKRSLDKGLRIRLESFDNYSNEYNIIEKLLCFYDFRQLFGSIYYNLPYKLPRILSNKSEDNKTIDTQDNIAKTCCIKKQIDPVSYIFKTLNQGEAVTYKVLDEFIADLNSVVENKIVVEDAKFNWKNMTIKNFPELAEEEETFKALLLDFKAAFPEFYKTKA